MSLTRPTLNNILTNVAVLSDAITVLHGGANQPNTDVGFLMNRANGLVSNVAIYWNEAGNTFVTAFTSNSGATDTNVAVSSYANLTTGGINAVTINATGNVTVANLITTGAYGNITGANVINANTISSITGIYTGGLTVAGNIVTTSTGYLTIPVGTTVQRPLSPSSGMIRYNSTLSSFEGYGSAWSSLGGVKSVDGNTYILAEATVGAGDNTLWFYNNATNTAKLTTSNLTLLQNTPSTSTGTGALIVTGGVGVAGSLNVGSNVTVSGHMLPSANVAYDLGSSSQRWRTLYISGNTIVMGGGTISMSPSGSFTFAYAGGSIADGTFANLTANSGVASTSTTTGALQIVGGAGITGSIYAGANVSIGGSTPGLITPPGSNSNLIIDPDGSGNVYISANTFINYPTPSTSTTTGALVVNGGAGITGDAYHGGNVVYTNRSYAMFVPVGSANWVGLRAPSSVSANVTFNLPGSDGTAGQFLKTDGAGNWSFASGGGGGGSSGFSVSTITTHPAAAGNKSLGTGADNVTEETPFSAGGTDAFGVSLGIVYDQMEPTGTTVTVDMGSGVAI